MEIQFQCIICQTKYSAKPDQAGNKGKCKNCGAEITVPQLISETLEMESGLKSNEKNFEIESDRKIPKTKNLRMNDKQRNLLILAGIVLAIVLLLTPQYQIIEGKKLPANAVKGIVNQYDYVAAIIRCVVVIAFTFSAYLWMKE